MPASSLIIGLDGADLHLVQAMGKEQLPHLHALMERGASAHLQSVLPPATLPNWCTFLTGLNPGKHGVFDFTTRKNYRVAFSGGTLREAPTVFKRLDALGKRCACLFFPATWPPEELEHGYFISGWDAPVAFEADDSYIWPPKLRDTINRKFGKINFDTVDEFHTEAKDWHAQLPAALCTRIEKKTELVSFLLDQKLWDAFAVYFGESDTASHHLWNFYDANSPRRPSALSPQMTTGLVKVYAALDKAVGVLIEHAGKEKVEVTVLSDHGFGGSSDKVLYLNRVLEAHGLLRFKRKGLSHYVARLCKEAGLRFLPPFVREKVFALAGRSLPSIIESQVRFSTIDMKGTKVFSDELNYFPALHLNLKERETHGTVRPDEVAALRQRIETALLGLKDPWTSKPVIKAVYAREDLFEGEFLDRAPDYLLQLHYDEGYSYNLMPSSAAPHEGAWRKLKAHEYLGQKGRSLAGSHRETGLFLAAGPKVEKQGLIECDMATATANALCRMDNRGMLDSLKPPNLALKEHFSRQLAR
ncbi:MAG: alkaline phosphatase family protein [Myxococcales bacterium]|nr:MAG: alkaline phosphatase family protein [Myxococcales bacterium]